MRQKQITAQEMKTVPSLLGLNKETAIEVIEQSGLNICVKGNDSDEEKATAQGDQSVAAGESVPEGTIVSVTITAVDALHVAQPADDVLAGQPVAAEKAEVQLRVDRRQGGESDAAV